MDTSSLHPLITLEATDSENDILSPTMSIENISNIHSTELCKSKGCSKSSRRSNSGSYIVDYGPVRIRHRRSISQTLATGRRSKDYPVDGEEAIKREIRRTKNRLAARELTKARSQVESDLMQTIKDLEQQANDLQMQHKQLEERKAQLNRAIYNARQAPLVPLIIDMSIPLFLKLNDHNNLLIDLHLLLESIDQEYQQLDS